MRPAWCGVGDDSDYISIEWTSLTVFAQPIELPLRTSAMLRLGGSTPMSIAGSLATCCWICCAEYGSPSDLDQSCLLKRQRLYLSDDDDGEHDAVSF